ncbi:A/G-specific adenine glycosylase [Magnetospirillum sulfuroxidans]|uniref:Adenine DNA glycosylase n=1 Tax=Magnetospirillum sulfuroxidans TaxID=611300 RepID=A0ABS5I9V5_9PROT|nr:A/G-specific adenine glycosylase [Magnetospirillum sulfuroxidans]MBR9971200.1 A/G-specific adenine glycosylase [Magnetospirillum sulfuroxidans]
MPVCDPTALSQSLLAWYDRAGRTLPWRKKGGAAADPYHVWLSEVMLQQTTVVVVAPYFLRFLERWPTVAALAGASSDEVMHAWAGLGYYARARNLHACAKVVAEWRGGAFPDDEESLRKLPGIGDYTAAAIAAIAFGRRAVVMDGNVERVMARLFAVSEPLPAAKPRLKALAASLTPDLRPGDYAQAVMDLGATLCTPRNPACGICPWMAACDGRKQGIEAELPAKLAKAERPTRHGVMFWAARKDGAVLLRRRPPQGLLGGMMEIPSTPWRESPWQADELAAEQPLAAPWRPLPGLVRHTFTHFHLELRLVAGKASSNATPLGIWVALDKLGDHALPSVMNKVIRHALAKAY